MRRVLPLLLALLAAPSAAAAVAEPFAEVERPVDLAFAPDGRLYAADLASGEILYVDAGGKATPILRVDASPGGNGGFTGLAVDPADPSALYAYYSAERPDKENGKENRIVRLRDGREDVLLANLPWAELHVGGRLAFGPDGLLYATTGDVERPEAAQNPANVVGKILRMTRDGAPAAGNPAPWHPYAFALGFRNPFGLVVTPDGRVFASDNGGTEEVNLVRGGRNYGWPDCSGPCGRDGIEDPLAAWEHPHFGPTGIDAAGNTLYLGDFVFGQVRTVDLATGATGILWDAPDAVLDVAVGPDGCLYVATWGAIHRIMLEESPCGLPDTTAPTPHVGDEVAPPRRLLPRPGFVLVVAFAALAAAVRRGAR